MPRLESPSVRPAISASGQKDNQECAVETRRLQKSSVLIGEGKVLLDRSIVQM
jgi:hypothetical protein